MASQQLYTSIRRAGVGLTRQASALPALSFAARRYAAAAGLDRSAVEERVLHVLTSFQKVDPKKVRENARAGGRRGDRLSEHGKRAALKKRVAARSKREKTKEGVERANDG